MTLDLETIGLVGAAASAAIKYFRSQTALVDIARHLASQNTDIIGRQTTILARLMAVQEHVLERIEALEEAGEEEEVVVRGFSPEGEEEDVSEGPKDEPANWREKANRARR